ncbi:hypothetical protein K3G39_08735 [Pontibacter sp. HSC-14F20]|uniref:hypothetical protein n=1 Tax=Pontibacter sp. HSC-14F20 TaxID=2864136 RepID=UPI001C73C885|nr:hypothetical protein [Pontibacter sp. HSC-14F20]MBX0333324.1 hypothetical protein [Pontibacter sp. HSC-14F20]
MKRHFLFALSLCTLVSCSQNEEEQYERLAHENAVEDVSSWVRADLQCEEIQNADEDNPLAVIYLSQVEMQHVLDTVYTCSVIAPQMYTAFGVPHHALSASGGWWAGQGNFYYTLHEGDSITVMHASPIQSDSVDFQYTLLRRLPVSQSTADDLPEENYMP